LFSLGECPGLLLATCSKGPIGARPPERMREKVSDRRCGHDRPLVNTSGPSASRGTCLPMAFAEMQPPASTKGGWRRPILTQDRLGCECDVGARDGRICLLASRGFAFVAPATCPVTRIENSAPQANRCRSETRYFGVGLSGRFRTSAWSWVLTSCETPRRRTCSREVVEKRLGPAIGVGD